MIVPYQLPTVPDPIQDMDIANKRYADRDNSQVHFWSGTHTNLIPNSSLVLFNEQIQAGSITFNVSFPFIFRKFIYPYVITPQSSFGTPAGILSIRIQKNAINVIDFTSSELEQKDIFTFDVNTTYEPNDTYSIIFNCTSYGSSFTQHYAPRAIVDLL